MYLGTLYNKKMSILYCNLLSHLSQSYIQKRRNKSFRRFCVL